MAVLDDYQKVAARCAPWITLGDDVEVTYFHAPIGTLEECAVALAPFDAVVAMRERTRFSEELFGLLPRLRLLVVTGQRNNRAVDIDAAVRAGVRVAHTRNNRSDVVAHTWALIHAVTRNVVTECLNIRMGGWQSTIGMSLPGKQLGLVGFGKVGRSVGEIANLFEMRVVAWSPHLNAERLAPYPWCELVTEKELYQQSDIVSVHMVLSDETIGMVGPSQLGWMRTGGVFINTSRGALVDEPSLARALSEGRLAGAGLDVFATEPLPPDHLFRTLRNVVATPHIGYVTKEVYEDWYGQAVASVKALLDSDPIGTQ